MLHKTSAAPMMFGTVIISLRKTAPRILALTGLSAQKVPALSAVVPRWARGWKVKPKLLQITAR